MQVDAIATVVISGVSFIFGIGLSWGLMSQKVKSLIEHSKEYRDDQDKKNETFVTHNYFDAVTSPLRQAVDTIQKDIKEILKLVRS